MCLCRPAEVLEEILKNAQPAEMATVLMLAQHLFATQPQLSAFPDKALKVRHWSGFARVAADCCAVLCCAVCRI